MNETGCSHVHVQKGLHKNLYITIVGALDVLSLTPSCSPVKTPEHTEYKTDDPEPIDEGNIHTEYFFD